MSNFLPKLSSLSAVLVGLALGVSGQPVAAQDYPTRPITLVVGSSAGSAPDTLSRIISVKMAELLGQPIVVENRPGAAGSIAATSVARSEADGYTMMMMTAVHSISPSLRENLEYNTSEDFSGVGMVASVPLIFVVNEELGVSDMDGFVERAMDGDIFYSTPGVGTLQHLATEDFSRAKGIEMTMIPYRGGGAATQAVIANEVQLFFAGIPPALPHVRDGTITALGISTPSRSPAAPDVPTFQELGFPDYNVDNWHALMVPADTPRDIVVSLSDALNTVLAMPDVAAQMLNVGATPNPSSPEAMDAWVASEMARWESVIEENGITLEN